MKKYIKYLSAALIVAVFGCSRKATDYLSFLGGKEVVYPGVATGVNVLPGNLRLKLAWHPSSDPSVAKYVVYWNNYADSLIVPATSHDPSDTVSCVIPGLQEYVYTFFINSYDSAGNKSITTEVDNARVYGPIYQTNLLNRPVNTDSPFVVQDNQTDVLLNFLTPDTINTNTQIIYTNTSEQKVSLDLAATNNSIMLTNYKFGTSVLYQSSYIPKQGAIDTFTTFAADTFPAIYKYVVCDKSLFKPLNLPNDMQPYDGGTVLSNLWNGATTPQGYPDIFHSNGAQPLPQHFSFDMGKVYNNIAQIQEIGRNCCHNPTDFEIWGIADTTNAITQLPGNDPGWKNEAISKGWTLLSEIVRTDVETIDGSSVTAGSPMTFNFTNNPPPVRFIMVRVLKTADDPNYVNLTQLTFWYKTQ